MKDSVRAFKAEHYMIHYRSKRAYHLTAISLRRFNLYYLLTINPYRATSITYSINDQ